MASKKASKDERETLKSENKIKYLKEFSFTSVVSSDSNDGDGNDDYPHDNAETSTPGKAPEVQSQSNMEPDRAKKKKDLKEQNKIQYWMEYSFESDGDDDYDIGYVNDEDKYNQNEGDLSENSALGTKLEEEQHKSKAAESSTSIAEAKPKQDSKGKVHTGKEVQDDSKNGKTDSKPQEKKPVVRHWWKKPDSVLL